LDYHQSLAGRRKSMPRGSAAMRTARPWANPP